MMNSVLTQVLLPVMVENENGEEDEEQKNDDNNNDEEEENETNAGLAGIAELFIQMQQIKSQEQKLNTQHSQLLLEQSTWQSQGRVENSAEKKHNMKEIAPNDMKIIKIH